MIKEIKGDLVKLAKEGYFDAIVHGANCFVTMGSGIAAQIRKEIPEAYKVDQQTKSGDVNKLGTITYTTGTPVVINAYTQYHWSKIAPDGSNLVMAPMNTVLVDYDAVRSCMKEVRKLCGTDWKIGLPLIGCGLARGDWNIIKQIIIDELSDCNVYIVHYDG